MDGTLVTSQKEAENYCHRRNAQIQDKLLSLAGETIAYSGSDLESISQQLASQWVTAKQRGLNLQDLEAERWKLIARYGSKGAVEWMNNTGSGGLLVLTEDVDREGSPQQRSKPITQTS